MDQNKTILYLLTEQKFEYRFLQPLWDLRIGNEDYAQSPLFLIVLSIVCYFLCMVPFTVLDLFGKNCKALQQYKIQPDKEVTWLSVRKAILLTLWNQLVYILPLSLAQWVWASPDPLPILAPTVWEVCSQCLGALAIFDLEYFVWHMIHHKVRLLYKHVHSIHHQYHSPSVWVTQYLHPLELISLGVFTATSPWFFNSHTLTQWVYQLLNIIASVEIHTGYDFPGLPQRWCRFWGGSIKHDMHHQKPLTNFAPFFNYCDMLMGSYCPGQEANGHRPAALLEWESADADEKAERRRRLKNVKSKQMFTNQHF